MDEKSFVVCKSKKLQISCEKKKVVKNFFVLQRFISNSQLNKFSANPGDICDKQAKRFHQDIKVKNGYQGQWCICFQITVGVLKEVVQTLNTPDVPTNRSLFNEC